MASLRIKVYYFLLVILLSGCKGIALPGMPSSMGAPNTMTASQHSANPATIPMDAKFVIDTLPVGEGNCQVMICPADNKIVVMDCGSGGTTEKSSVPYWTRENVWDYFESVSNTLGSAHRRLPEFVVSVSHPDPEHYNYLTQALHGRTISSFVLGGKDGLQSYDNLFQNWMKSHLQAGALLEDVHNDLHPGRSETLSCHRSRIVSHILTLNAGTTTDDNSMVVATQYSATQAALFSGDATDITFSDVHGPYYVSIFTAANHGAITNGSNHSSWAMPGMEVLLLSGGGLYRHPQCRAIDNLRTYLPTASPSTPLRCYSDAGVLTSIPNNQQTILSTFQHGFIRTWVNAQGAIQWTFPIAQ